MEALKHNFLTRRFFKKRGYEDQAERHEIPRLPTGAPEKRFVYPARKLFEADDSARLKKGKTLDEAGRHLEANRFGAVVVASYADLKGDTEKERELTEARAALAREHLVEHFQIDDSKVKTLAGGRSEPAMEGGQLEALVYPADVTLARRK